jgi:hypothetical protein
LIASLPRPTFDGLVDYMGLAVGLVLGAAIFKAPAVAVSEAISKSPKGTK